MERGQKTTREMIDRIKTSRRVAGDDKRKRERVVEVGTRRLYNDLHPFELLHERGEINILGR